MVTLGTAVELIGKEKVRLEKSGDLWTYAKVMDVHLGRGEFIEDTTDGNAQQWYAGRDSVVDFEIKATTPEIKTLLAATELNSGLASVTTWSIIYPSMLSDGTATEVKLDVLGTMARGIDISMQDNEVSFIGSLRITSDVTSASVS